MRNGIDISSYNTGIDYNKLKENGIEYVIIRCGYGREVTQKDKMLETHYSNCKGKFKLGTYLYSYANSVEGARLEAQNTLRLIEGKEFDYVFYDLEDKKTEVLDRETITQMYFAYKEIIEASGYKCGIYSNKYWANNKIYLDRINDIKWIASYGKNDGNIPSEANKYNGCDIWQYTDKGKIGGINRYCDLNIVYNWNSNSVIAPTTTSPQSQTTTDDGSSVRFIQSKLNSKYGCNIAVDNIFGNETKKALVKAFQAELNNQFGKGLAVDGIFGSKTKEACVSIKKGASGNITFILQAALICRGYSLKADGIFGSGTEKSVKAFQLNNNLVVDGIVGKNTFEKLLK